MKPIISAQALHEQASDSQCVVLDARWDLMRPAWGRDAFEARHIPGARYVSLDEDLAASVTATSGRHPLPDPEVCVETFRKLGVNNQSKVVVYDQASGAFAARAWWMLQWLGHFNTQILDGGLAAWDAAGLPVDCEPEGTSRGDLSGAGNADWLVGTDQILDQIAAGLPLVDARDAARFAGDVEPIDSVAGHVPGAANAAFSDFLDEQSMFLPASVLRERWTKVVGIQPEQDWMVMCGSGVTACHLAVSGRIAGLRMPRLYAGSWSEWIRNPARPVVAGPSISG